MTPEEPAFPLQVRSFFVGGEQVRVTGQPVGTISPSVDLPAYRYDPNGTYPAWHAYVEARIPDPAPHPPVVLVHGGGLTGACWDTTPDGRAGWATEFPRAGWPSYIVDLPERGRAGWCPMPGVLDERPIMRSAEEMWEVFRIGAPDGFAGRAAFAGTQFPVENFDASVYQSVPRWLSTAAQARAALIALITTLGRCFLVGHSQGGGIVAHVAAQRPDLVAGAVLIEPHGLPGPDALPEHLPPQLLVLGDRLDDVGLYRTILPVWRSYAAARTGVDVLDLPAIGEHGNTHMPMWDRNSARVAGLIQDWLAAH